jgi:hypothetical protein
MKVNQQVTHIFNQELVGRIVKAEPSRVQVCWQSVAPRQAASQYIERLEQNGDGTWRPVYGTKPQAESEATLWHPAKVWDSAAGATVQTIQPIAAPPRPKKISKPRKTSRLKRITSGNRARRTPAGGRGIRGNGAGGKRLGSHSRRSGHGPRGSQF